MPDPIVDIHQHLWPEALLEALARRREAPRLIRDAGGWTLRTRGELDAPIDLADHDPDRRAALAAADGIGLALIAPSVPLGIETLPKTEAEPLLAAYHDGVAALPDPFGAWAAVGLDAPERAELGALLDRGFVGACISADAIDGADGLDRLGGVLELLERRGAPLLVHPGPASADPGGRPAWWGALTDYVAAMQRAWYAFALWGRPAHPGLKVCFAMLAGLAPLHRERLVARGGRTGFDENVFLDSSSYGARTIDLVVRETGIDQLVFGSDLPVAAGAAAPGEDAVGTALGRRNPARLLAAPGVPA